MLLMPLTDTCIRDLSLRSHLALVASGYPGSDRHSVMWLARVVYVAFFLQERSRSDSSLSMFVAAEEALDRTVLRAEETGVWQLMRDDIEVLKPVLRIYDQELASATNGCIAEADASLRRLLASPHCESPLRASLRDRHRMV